jgi:hypothetical protein
MCLQLLSVKYIPREHPGIKNELFRGQEEPFPNGWSLSEALLEAIYVVNHAALFTVVGFFLLYLYYTCEQFTSGCQETSKFYKYLQWTI